MFPKADETSSDKTTKASDIKSSWSLEPSLTLQGPLKATHRMFYLARQPRLSRIVPREAVESSISRRGTLRGELPVRRMDILQAARQQWQQRAMCW